MDVDYNLQASSIALILPIITKRESASQHQEYITLNLVSECDPILNRNALTEIYISYYCQKRPH